MIVNAALKTTLTLDWSNPERLVRTDESGGVQRAGGKSEVWVDFNWNGQTEGDFYHPFNTIAAAVDTVEEGGTIRIMTGTAHERLTIHKRVRLTAVGGPATVRAR